MCTTETEKSKYGKRYGSLVGSRYGRWLITSGPVEGRLPKRPYWECRCDCGSQKAIEQAVLVRGKSTSCGCLKREQAKERLTQHGDTGERLHNIWIDMKRRCEQPGRKSAKYYHDEGKRVCSEWQDYQVFKKWALSHGYKADLSIERQDVTQGYYPENCSWIPRNRQSYNRRDTIRLTAFGETKTLHQWVDDDRCHVNADTIMSRISTRHWEVERAIKTPNMSKRKL